MTAGAQASTEVVMMAGCFNLRVTDNIYRILSRSPVMHRLTTGTMGDIGTGRNRESKLRTLVTGQPFLVERSGGRHIHLGETISTATVCA